MKRFKEAYRYSRYVYQNELYEACFQHDMTQESFRDLPRRTASHKVLRYKTYNIAKIQNMMDINVDLFEWFTDLLIKRLLVLILKLTFCKTKNKLKNYANQVLESLKKEN